MAHFPILALSRAEERCRLQFVTEAWKEKLEANHPSIHFVADDDGAWTSALGMGFAAQAFFGNVRSSRYAMIVEDGVVKALEKDEDPSKT